LALIVKQELVQKNVLYELKQWISGLLVDKHNTVSRGGMPIK